jgi:hypothetical protein
MKIKLLTLLVASFTMIACGQDKKEETATDATSKIAVSIAPVAKKFDGDKYIDTKITGEPDYYIMYFTASW